ncbi:MAG: NAD(P)H-binding protein [Gammaproteobacteria bacterium]|nr:NAD(P)H-binding protein [Gammaproteobacteria bacterium]
MYTLDTDNITLYICPELILILTGRAPGNLKNRKADLLNTATSIAGNTLALFGASGATGRAIIDQALHNGLKVRALVRAASSLAIRSPQLDIITGALLNREDVTATLTGCTTAICVFGPRPPYRDIFCAEATALIVEVMRGLSIRRLLCQTGGMIGDYRANRTWPFQLMTTAFNKRLPAIAADRAKQEQMVRDSGLDWTLIKPPRLTDGAARGTWRAGTGVRLGMLSSLTRTDLSAFVIDETLHNHHLHQAVFIKN